MRFAVVAHRRSETNVALAEAGGGAVVGPRDALLTLGPGDVALARLDVLDTVDGVEPGIESVGRLAAADVTVLNLPRALLAAHDKLLTARALRLAGLPHPWTTLLPADHDIPRDLPFPVVIKPRFGSWGRDVRLCRDREELQQTVEELALRPWFARDGALLQELVPPRGYDLRVVVAAGTVVGAARRDAAPGEWRTNVALGGKSSPVEPPLAACRLALQAAAAVAADFVGVDLLPEGDTHVILELNAAVDVKPWYAPGRDLARDAVLALLERAGPARAA
jgi:RimK family alpha-L-glutamate ligase